MAGHQPVAVRPHYNTLGNFQFEKKVGQGQFSVVFKARNTVDGECVALKKIQVSISEHSLDAYSRFSSVNVHAFAMS